jgi:cell division protein FtsN
MDHRVRDLDQIQEQDSDDRSRRLGTILMATAAIVGLSLAVGVVVGRAAEPPAKTDDPLAKLERAAAVGSATTSLSPKPEPAAPSVQAADLSFPATLTEDEDRPEVLAALKAAEAEEAALGEPQPKAAPAKAQPMVAASADDDDEDSNDGAATSPPAAKAEPPAPPRTVSTETMIANIPAAVAAGVGARNLRKAVKHDPLVAAAIHSDDVKAAAPHGHEGEFVLQVISYDRPEPSRAFAEGLRAKGHMAFVVTAEIKERGKYFRVRIGPWKSREQAEAYRHKFEEQEHMNTFVVHEKEKQAGPPAP